MPNDVKYPVVPPSRLGLVWFNRYNMYLLSFLRLCMAVLTEEKLQLKSMIAASQQTKNSKPASKHASKPAHQML